MQKDLSIVIPCYNENSRGNFQYRLDKLISFMCENTNIDFEIILVNDGSTDDTLKVIKYYEDNYEFVKVITYKKNVGKSHALKQGIRRAVGDYTLMMDADLNVPLKNINKFYNYISKATLHHLVIAVRTNKYENRSSARKFLSRMAHLSTSILLGIPNIKDTQCGFKMFKTDKAVRILPCIRSKRWLFDIELILYMQAQGIKVRTYDVKAREDVPSTINSMEALKSSIKELLMIVFTRRSTIKQIQNT